MFEEKKQSLLTPGFEPWPSEAKLRCQSNERLFALQRVALIKWLSVLLLRAEGLLGYTE